MLPQIVNQDLHKAYADLKNVLQQDLDLLKARKAKHSSGGSWAPVAAIALLAIGAFYYLAKR
jgi:hypothetical protein